jgi:hypothetical protein
MILTDALPQLSVRPVPDRYQKGSHCMMHMTRMTKHVVKHPHHPE